jgi:hypothetical protein
MTDQTTVSGSDARRQDEQPQDHLAADGGSAVQGLDAAEAPTFCYSLDEEDFSMTELHDALYSLDCQGDLKPGAVVYEGEAFKQQPSYFFSLDHMLEAMGECAYDNGGGEWSEDFPDMPKEKRDELNALICGWLDANVEVGFWGVRNIKAITVTAELIAEHGFADDGATTPGATS